MIKSGTINNPNRCEVCIGVDRPEDKFDFADTGICGACGIKDEVWDLPHLAALFVQGKSVYSSDRVSRVNRPIRSSHDPSESNS